MDVQGLCVELDLDLEITQLFIEFPVGFSLEIEGPIVPNPGDIAGKLLAKANAALAPLSPLFDIVDLLLVVGELFEAAKKFPKIGALVKLSPKLRTRLDKLKKLIPQLSVPRTIKSIIQVLIVALLGLRAELLAIIEAQSSLDLRSARALALGNADLAAAVECAQANLDFQLDLALRQAAPLNRFINTVNLLADLAKLPKIPALVVDASAGASGALSPIDALIEKLRALYKSISV